MIRQELRQPALRERMAEQPLDRRKRAGRHIGSGIETLDDMARVTDRGRQHLRPEPVGPIIRILLF